MQYSELNKLAWEDAFEHRGTGFEPQDIYRRCKEEESPFFQVEVIEELDKIDFTNKHIAQFCCNNGRELLSLMKRGAVSGIGFDIAENMVANANEAAKLLRFPCTFVATDILKIDRSYHDRFDFILITIGALTWFKDLNEFFAVVSACLKDGGVLLINDTHPFANMLGAPGEDGYEDEQPKKILYSYFKVDPWVEVSGMKYLTENGYDSKTFYSFSHSFSKVFAALYSNHIYMYNFREFDYDLSENFLHLDSTGVPLSYLLVAKKKLEF